MRRREQPCGGLGDMAPVGVLRAVREVELTFGEEGEAWTASCAATRPAPPILTRLRRLRTDAARGVWC